MDQRGKAGFFNIKHLQLHKNIRYYSLVQNTNNMQHVSRQTLWADKSHRKAESILPNPEPHWRPSFWYKMYVSENLMQDGVPTFICSMYNKYT